MPRKTAASANASGRPVVRPDGRGYILDGEWFDGFTDRDDLSIDARRYLAVLADRYGSDEVSEAQRALAKSRSDANASDLLRALAHDEADLNEAFREGLYDGLGEDELRIAREQSYPLAIGKVSELTGATARQLRHWEELGLMRSYQLGAHRRYLRGSVLRALALVKEEQHVVATLGKAMREPTHFVRLVGLLLRDENDADKRATAAREFINVGLMLDETVLDAGSSLATVTASTSVLSEPEFSRRLEPLSAVQPEPTTAEIVSLAPVWTLRFLTGVVAMLEDRNDYEAGASPEVAALAELTAEEMGVSPDAQRHALLAGLLRNIGKLGLSPDITTKRGALTLDQRREMQTHSVVGEELLATVFLSSDVASAVRHHHERWDGHGYPDGLIGEQIPLVSRVIQVADAFVAMTHNRPYRDAMPTSAATERLRHAAGTQFDHAVVEAFVRAIERHQYVGGDASGPAAQWDEYFLAAGGDRRARR